MQRRREVGQNLATYTVQELVQEQFWQQARPQGFFEGISEKMRPWERDWFLQKFQCRHDIILK